MTRRERLERLEATGWYSTASWSRSYALPEYSELVVVRYEHGYGAWVGVGTRCDKAWALTTAATGSSKTFMVRDGDRDYRVTHWRPLPEFPGDAAY